MRLRKTPSRIVRSRGWPLRVVAVVVILAALLSRDCGGCARCNGGRLVNCRWQSAAIRDGLVIGLYVKWRRLPGRLENVVKKRWYRINPG